LARIKCLIGNVMPVDLTESPQQPDQGKPPSQNQDNFNEFQRIPRNSAEIKVNEIIQLQSEFL
jgi:hypothetical protein